MIKRAAARLELGDLVGKDGKKLVMLRLTIIGEEGIRDSDLVEMGIRKLQDDLNTIRTCENTN